MSEKKSRKLERIDERYREMIVNEELPRCPEVVVPVDAEAEEVARELFNRSDRSSADLWEWLNDVVQPQMVFELEDGTEVRPD
jgi:hypothetical protein